MRDARLAELAGRQFNRVSRAQLLDLGLTDEAIAYRVASGRLVRVEQGVFAVAPVLEHDNWGRWMGATLTAPNSVLSHASGAAAWGFWSLQRPLETVTRPGCGGPRRHGGVLAYRSSTLQAECAVLRGIPITSVPRTLLDLARQVSDRAAGQGRSRSRSARPDYAHRAGRCPRRPSRATGFGTSRGHGCPVFGTAARSRSEWSRSPRLGDPPSGWAPASETEHPDRG